MRSLILLTLFASGTYAAETLTFNDGEIAVFNLAGEVRLEPANGSAIEAIVETQGRDREKLQIDTVTTTVNGARMQALVVRYPGRDVVFRDGAWGGSTNVRVADDGTFHRSHGARVNVRGRGNGIEAHADIVLRVPAGSAVSAYVAVGAINAAGVDGQFYLDTHAGNIEANNINGEVFADSGSGNVRLQGISGNSAGADTGSGDVVLIDIAARDVGADTGSGDVRLRDIRAEKLLADTGSGDVTLDYPVGGRMLLDTGSGDVMVLLETGVGLDLNIDTGSGRISTQLDDMEVRVVDRDKYIARRGDGELRLTIDTGSGNVAVSE